jgi:hypothetical protein
MILDGSSTTQSPNILVRLKQKRARLVGLNGAFSLVRIFAPPTAFAPKPHLAYDGDNDSRNGKKEAPS